MPISQELLDILACPVCKGDLEYDAGKDTLTCRECQLVYEIKDDIPIMLIDQAIDLRTGQQVSAERVQELLAKAP